MQSNNTTGQTLAVHIIEVQSGRRDLFVKRSRNKRIRRRNIYRTQKEEEDVNKISPSYSTFHGDESYCLFSLIHALEVGGVQTKVWY